MSEDPTLSTDVPVAALRGRFRGRVLGPDDPGYDAARTVTTGGIDAHPAVIVRVADSGDVASVIALARERGLGLAVRSGGHSVAGHSTVDGGIVLDVRDLDDLDIDLEGRTAWAGAGLTAGRYTAAVGAHGFATGFGDTGSVGVSGLTLGGGMGFLVRTHGLTIDNLLAAEIVTAEGQTLRVDESSHPDLFWAIRGGGGNFGVVTRLKFRLHPVDRVLGGVLVLPATADVVEGVVAAAQTAPDELTVIANVMSCPPLPFVPAEHHGTVVVMALICFAGDPAAGERALAPILSLAAPIANLVGSVPYPDLFPPEDSEHHPTAVSRAMFATSIDREAAETIVTRLAASDAPMRAVQLRALGGAVARVPDDATAFAHRSSPLMVAVASFFEGPDDRPRRAAWVDELAGALDQGIPGAYVNFLSDDAPESVRAAYPGPTWDRLAAVKARYDPTNLFRRNYNVAPASMS